MENQARGASGPIQALYQHGQAQGGKFDPVKKNEYADIELTDKEIAVAVRSFQRKLGRKVLFTEERNEALRLARATKWGHLNEAAYWDRLGKPKPEIKLPTAGELFDQVVRLGNQYLAEKAGSVKEFLVDSQNQTVITLLCQYFSGDSAFESFKEGFSLNKGIYLVGNNGCGKTMLMKLFKTNPRMSFSVISSRRVAMDYEEIGPGCIKECYSGLIPIADNQFGQSKLGICFDDCGDEVDSRGRYGDGIRPMELVLKQRYSNLPYQATHITSNVSPYDLATTMYGSETDQRMLGRIKESFNQIFFPEDAQSRRR